MAALAISDTPDGRRVLSLSGRLDATTIRRVWAEGRQAIAAAPGRRVVVDAANVDYCDGAGIGLIVDMLRQRKRGDVEVTNLKRSENVNDKIVMEFAVKSVSFGGKTYPLSGTVANADIERVRNEPKGKDAQKVATGAVVGAIAGQIFGHSTKSTIIGAAAGAAAGGGVAAATSNFEGCVPEGGSIAVDLSAPLQVRVTS